MTTTLSLGEASAAEVYDRYRLRDWIEHYYKPIKHELGWADCQVRPARAIERHWHLVMLAYTFSLLVGTLPADPATSSLAAEGGGEITPSRLANHVAPSPHLAVSLGPPAPLLAHLVS